MFQQEKGHHADQRISRKRLQTFLVLFLILLSVPVLMASAAQAETKQGSSKEISTPGFKSREIAPRTCYARYHSGITGREEELPYTFADTWFLKEHTALDQNIAKASIALAAAAYSEKNVKEALTQEGAEFQILKSEFPNPDRKNNDVAGYVIARRKIGEKYLYLVVVRGTPGNAEWYSNFHIGTDGKEHQGFFAAAKPILDELEKAMKQTKRDQNILWLTGHSRGAAIAGILAGKVSTEKRYQKCVNPNHLFCYTFGSPTYLAQADTSLKNIYNFCNEGDMVTQVPPPNYQFERYGRTLAIDRSQQIIVRQRFRERTGKTYAGYMRTPAAVRAMEEWIGDPKNYEKKTRLKIRDYLEGGRSGIKAVQNLMRLAGGKSTNFSKYELMLACAALLQKEDVKTQEAAIRKLAVALATDQMPVKVAAVYLGERIVRKMLVNLMMPDALGIVRELAESPNYMPHAHCQELYYAWTEIL